MEGTSGAVELDFFREEAGADGPNGQVASFGVVSLAGWFGKPRPLPHGRKV